LEKLGNILSFLRFPLTVLEFENDAASLPGGKGDFSAPCEFGDAVAACSGGDQDRLVRNDEEEASALVRENLNIRSGIPRIAKRDLSSGNRTAGHEVNDFAG
jgi:hypothetical protein